MNHLAFIPIVLAAAAMTFSSAAQSLSEPQREQILAEAQQAYDRGVAMRRDDPAEARRAFGEAAARYQQLVDDGVVNGALHYNLGNALLQSGDVGRAILHYRAAETLIPGDAALEHNLEYARSLRDGQIEPTGARALADALLGWHTDTRTGLRFSIFAVVWVAVWAVLVVMIYRRAAAWKWTAGALVLIAVASGVSVGWDVIGTGTDVGVITSDDAIARKGNGEGFDPAFRESLPEGTEFTVLEQRPGWLRIELPDGKTGWVSGSDAALVRSAIAGNNETRL